MDKFASTVCLTLLCAGCASTMEYRSPPPYPPVAASVDIPRPRADVWKTAVPLLAKQFFVINNIDQSSGLMNLSYAGDPERFVDCGQASVTLPNEAPVVFPAARATQSYRLLTPNAGIIFVNRQVALEGRINLVFEEIGPSSTRVSATTRYIVSREVHARAANGASQNDRRTASFNTNQSGTYVDGTGQTITCYPTGELEKDLLNLIR